MKYNTPSSSYIRCISPQTSQPVLVLIPPPEPPNKNQASKTAHFITRFALSLGAILLWVLFVAIPISQKDNYTTPDNTQLPRDTSHPAVMGVAVSTIPESTIETTSVYTSATESTSFTSYTTTQTSAVSETTYTVDDWQTNITILSTQPPTTTTTTPTTVFASVSTDIQTNRDVSTIEWSVQTTTDVSVSSTTTSVPSSTTCAFTAVTGHSQASADVLAQEILHYVNEQRAIYGATPVVFGSNTMQAGANIRAAEASSFFSHTRPDGRDFSTVCSDINVQYRMMGENLLYSTPAVSAEAMVQMWMQSSSHKKNIINEEFTYMNIAYCYVDNTIYVAQHFYKTP